jgi:antitoxin ParD1/3/4/toxin ParE1/3/4
MAPYLLTNLAKADVREIVSYIRKRSPEAATRVRGELRDAMRLVAEFPGIGHLREDVTDEPIRFWSVYSYLIAYRPDTRPLWRSCGSCTARGTCRHCSEGEARGSGSSPEI